MTEHHDPLDLLLLAATEELLEPPKKQTSLKETNLFSKESNLSEKPPIKSVNGSLLHTGDTDSSDDEDRRNWEEKRYTESGRDIKKLLDAPSITRISTNKTRISRVSDWKKPPLPSINKATATSNSSESNNTKFTTETGTKRDVYSDPIFGLRIINPLISSTVLIDLMTGREAISFSRLNRFLQIKTKDKDWVIAGAIVHKSAAKTSQKGSQFSVWTLSDLKDDIKTVAVFLFSGAHQQLWKTSVGTIVGLLNPNILDKKDGKDEACLSIDNAQKVMIFGQSKDFGTCKSVKKNGDKCTAIVNINRCEYCVYHIKQEYQKCSIRSDLQSSFGGRGLTSLRNKVLGKNEVFYAGKSYMAIPAKKSRKLEQKDNTRLNGLNTKPGLQTKSVNLSASSKKKKTSAARLEVPHAQRLKDLQLLEKLGGTMNLSEKVNFEGKQSSDVTIEDARTLATSVLNKLKAKTQFSETPTTSCSVDVLDAHKHKQITQYDKFEEVEENLSKLMESPVVKPDNKIERDSRSNILLENKSDKKQLNSNNPLIGFPKLTGYETGLIDLSKPIHSRRSQKAKLNAVNLIQKKGPIKKLDPNNIRGTGIKRPIEVEGGDKLQNDTKKPKVENNSFTSERFKKIMAAGSSHQDLLEARDDEEKEKYFHKLETKEKMEEKMIGTHKIACKAVKCFQCKYVSFSASDLCKSERHTLKVFDAVKRFFKCVHCHNRTVCLEIVPLKACNNCGGSNWQKTGMMKEKIANAAHALSIRGGEQKFANSVITDANLDLLVPD